MRKRQSKKAYKNKKTRKISQKKYLGGLHTAYQENIDNCHSHAIARCIYRICKDYKVIVPGTDNTPTPASPDSKHFDDYIKIKEMLRKNEITIDNNKYKMSVVDIFKHIYTNDEYIYSGDIYKGIDIDKDIDKGSILFNVTTNLNSGYRNAKNRHEQLTSLTKETNQLNTKLDGEVNQLYGEVKHLEGEIEKQKVEVVKQKVEVDQLGVEVNQLGDKVTECNSLLAELDKKRDETIKKRDETIKKNKKTIEKRDEIRRNCEEIIKTYNETVDKYIETDRKYEEILKTYNETDEKYIKTNTEYNETLKEYFDNHDKLTRETNENNTLNNKVNNFIKSSAKQLLGTESEEQFNNWNDFNKCINILNSNNYNIKLTEQQYNEYDSINKNQRIVYFTLLPIITYSIHILKIHILKKNILNIQNISKLFNQPVEFSPEEIAKICNNKKFFNDFNKYLKNYSEIQYNDNYTDDQLVKTQLANFNALTKSIRDKLKGKQIHHDEYKTDEYLEKQKQTKIYGIIYATNENIGKVFNNAHNENDAGHATTSTSDHAASLTSIKKNNNTENVDIQYKNSWGIKFGKDGNDTVENISPDSFTLTGFTVIDTDTDKS